MSETYRPKDNSTSGYLELILFHDTVLEREDLPHTSRAYITGKRYDYEGRLTLSERQRLIDIRTELTSVAKLKDNPKGYIGLSGFIPFAEDHPERGDAC